jgi:hypothetical protein
MTLRQSSTSTSESEEKTAFNALTAFYGAIWVVFVIYAFGLSPGGTPETDAIDKTIITQMIQFPPPSEANPVLFALFNSLGIIPAIYASLLLPGGKTQKFPALPFVVGSFALGFFSVGPYLALRSLSEDVTKESKGKGSAPFESKLTPVFLSGFGAYLMYIAISGNGYAGDAPTDFIEMWKASRLPNVSAIDFTILSLVVRRLNTQLS